MQVAASGGTPQGKRGIQRQLALRQGPQALVQRIDQSVGLAQPEGQAHANRALDGLQQVIDCGVDGTGSAQDDALRRMGSRKFGPCLPAGRSASGKNPHRGYEKAARRRLFATRFRRCYRPDICLIAAFSSSSEQSAPGAFRRHGVDTGNRLGQQAIEAALLLGALAPLGLVANLRRAQQAGAVAGVAGLADDVFAGTRTAATGGCRDGADAFAFLALYADLAYRLEALGDRIVSGRSLSAYSPQGQHGSLGRQHFFNQVHPYTLIVAYHTRARYRSLRAARAGASITAKKARQKQLHTLAKPCGIRSQPRMPLVGRRPSGPAGSCASGQKFAGVVALIKRAGTS